MKADPSEPLVVLTSDEPHGVIGNSHQHYFDVLSKKYDTVFVQPPGRWNPRRWFAPRALTAVSERAALFQYVNYFPVSLCRVFFTRLNDAVNAWFLRRLVKGRRQVVLWKFDSFRMMNVRLHPAQRTVYHVVDPVFRKETDRHVARSADLVVVVNRAYSERYSAYGKPVMYIPHGIRSEDLAPPGEASEKLRGKYGPYLLVTGSINHDTNLPLLQRIADTFPERSLLLVGPDFLRDPVQRRQLAALQSRSNVRLAGVVHYHELKHWVAAAAVCLVPYLSRAEAFTATPSRSPTTSRNASPWSIR
jgi:glycosyltransferase involved in cell wall biosynthesis